MGLKLSKLKEVSALLNRYPNYVMLESYTGSCAVLDKESGEVRPLVPTTIADKFMSQQGMNHTAYKLMKNTLDPDGLLKYENREVTIETLAFILGCKESDIEEKISILADKMSTETSVDVLPSVMEYIRNIHNKNAVAVKISGRKFKKS